MQSLSLSAYSSFIRLAIPSDYPLLSGPVLEQHGKCDRLSKNILVSKYMVEVCILLRIDMYRYSSVASRLDRPDNKEVDTVIVIALSAGLGLKIASLQSALGSNNF